MGGFFSEQRTAASTHGHGDAVNVSNLFVRGVLAELRIRKLDVAPLIANAGIDESRLGNLSCAVSIEVFEQLVSKVQELQDPSFAALAGARLPFSALHWLGFLLRGAGSLRECLKIFERYSVLLADPLKWRLREEGSEAHVVCAPELLRGEAARFAVEFAFAVALSAADRLVPVHDRSTNVRLHFAFSPPERNPRFPQPQVLRFHERENAIVFPRSLLDVGWDKTLDDTLLESFREFAEGQLSLHAQRGLAGRVRAILSYQEDLSQFDPKQLAGKLNVTERALRRRLAEEGVPLAELLAEVRRAAAIREMQAPQVAIKVLSERLGFSEPSAFHRAFKRWTGKTPSEYLRERAKGALTAVAGYEGQDVAEHDTGVFQMQKVPELRELRNRQARVGR